MENNIKAFRLAKGLTQQELADRLHVVRQTGSKWEKGLSAPNAELLLLLSEEFGVSVDTLLNGNAGKPSTSENLMTTEAQRRSFPKIIKPHFIAFFLLLAAISCQAIPYSVTEQFLIFSNGAPHIVMRAYSYFSPYFLLHSCCVPFLSAITGLAAAVFLCSALFSEKRAQKYKTGFFIVLSVSSASSTITFLLFRTLLSGIITGLLVAALILCLYSQKH